MQSCNYGNIMILRVSISDVTFYNLFHVMMYLNIDYHTENLDLANDHFFCIIFCFKNGKNYMKYF